MSTSRIQLKAIVEKTEGYSGAELKATCVEAGMIAILSDRDTVLNSDVVLAIDRLNKKKSRSVNTSSPEGLYG
jgi:proteasome regulatory subunit